MTELVGDVLDDFAGGVFGIVGEGAQKPHGAELDAVAKAAVLRPGTLPNPTEKLGSLFSTLTEDERAALSSVVTSASLHLKELQSINDEAEYIYSKPISAAATSTIRERLLDLPEVLGFNRVATQDRRSRAEQLSRGDCGVTFDVG